MKAFKIIAKIVVALAAIAGAVYVAATYGDKIVAWCKKMLSSCKCCCGGDCCCDGECCCEEADIAEEITEEAPVAEEEAPAEETPVEETAPVADETDFEG